MCLLVTSINKSFNLSLSCCLFYNYYHFTNSYTVCTIAFISWIHPFLLIQRTLTSHYFYSCHLLVLTHNKSFKPSFCYIFSIDYVLPTLIPYNACFVALISWFHRFYLSKKTFTFHYFNISSALYQNRRFITLKNVNLALFPDLNSFQLSLFPFINLNTVLFVSFITQFKNLQTACLLNK